MKKIIILTVTLLVLVSCKSIKKVKCDAYSSMEIEKNVDDTDIFKENMESMRKYSTSTIIRSN